jgi:hypothetical protein
MMLGATPVSAQIERATATPESATAQLVELKMPAPRMIPQLGDRGFRIQLRMASSSAGEIAYAAITNASGQVHNWIAYTSRASGCFLLPHYTKNIPIIGLRHPANQREQLDKYDGSDGSAGQNRPALIIADFNCDGPVAKGDAVSIQMQFWLRVDGKWLAANYAYEDITIE